MKNVILTVMFATTMVINYGVQATPIVNSFGLSSPDNLVTFSEVALADQTIVTNQFSPFGVTLTPGHHYNSQGNSDVFPGIDGDYVGVSLSTSFQIIFDDIVSEAAFGYAKNPTTVLVEALLGTTVVESFSQAVHYNNPSTAFLGFEGILFDRIQITANVNEGLIDNIQFNTNSVPEPSAIALMGLGLLGFGVSRRKIKK